MPALHTALRLVLEMQRHEETAPPSRAGGPGAGDRSRGTGAEAGREPGRSGSDRSERPISR